MEQICAKFGVSQCEIFRFYKLVTLKGLLFCVCVLCPLQSESYQEDIFLMTAGTESALSAAEWLGGIDRGDVFIFMYFKE
uniref:Uncharacterized protein n=1 Tax=Sinocyclocheilus rhinocerous TaxID=307959 RepID=A0A673L140_9TELE